MIATRSEHAVGGHCRFIFSPVTTAFSSAASADSGGSHMMKVKLSPRRQGLHLAADVETYSYLHALFSTGLGIKLPGHFSAQRSVVAFAL
jgi:hypothetical protein